MRIGTRINEQWLSSPNDDDLRYLSQLGVCYVDIELTILPGYAQTGRLDPAELGGFVDRLAAHGLRIERANTRWAYYREALLGLPDGQRQIEALCDLPPALAQVGVPLMGIQPLATSGLVPNGRVGCSQRYRRGGYQYPAYDLATAQAATYEPEASVSTDQLWDGLLDIYRQVIPVAEQAKVRVAIHGNDPPLYEMCGNPQIMCRFADFDRLFAEVPSPYNGITFCVGTRYESGEDIFEGIRHFGAQGKLFHVHFRNVQGTLPQGGYAEVFLDDGDLDMRAVAVALHQAGYQEVIDYDHPMGVSGAGAVGREYVGFCVGYMKAILESLPG